MNRRETGKGRRTAACPGDAVRTLESPSGCDVDDRQYYGHQHQKRIRFFPGALVATLLASRPPFSVARFGVVDNCRRVHRDTS